MNSVFYTLKSPSSFTSVDKVYRRCRELGINVKRRDISEWLSGQDSYTKHKSIRHKFSRNKIIVSGIDEQWQADLVDLQNLADSNDDVKYLLTVIDVFSKYAFVAPLRKKSSEAVTKAFQEIFNTHNRKPLTLQTDEGKEFLNKSLQTYLRKEGVYHFVVNSEIKAAIVERFNRTLKSKMWKYFTENNTHCYLDILEDLIHSYNNTYHRSIKMKPCEVNTLNAAKVWETLYGPIDKLHNNARFKFQKGDVVRISSRKCCFNKGYKGNWSEEIFEVDQCINRIPNVYRLKDLMGEKVKGIFYEQEMQKVKNKMNEYFKIERVIQTKRKGKNKMHFVKWLGYPDKFNSWIKDTDVVNFGNG